MMLHQSEGVSNPWKFAGGFLDSSTGLYKFGTRYDDPTLGRWTQQDPVGGSLGDLNAANRYIYAGDDPVNEVDPSGKDVVSCVLAILGVALIAPLATIAGFLSVSAFIDWVLVTLVFTGILSFGAALVIVVVLGLAYFIGEFLLIANTLYQSCIL